METNDKQRVERHFSALCRLSLKYNSERGPIRSSEPRGIKIVNRLKKFAEAFHNQLPIEMQDKFDFQISKGQSNIPKIMWVAYVPRGRSVSNSASVAICFGSSGEGCVAGLMDAAIYPQKLFAPKERLSNKLSQPSVNVDGNKPNLKYNNKFFNPLELQVNEFNYDIMLSHVLDSVNVLNRLLEESQQDGLGQYSSEKYSK